MTELAKEFEVSPAKITSWKQEFQANASATFVSPDTSREKEFSHLKAEKDRLLKKVGNLTIENDFLRVPARMPD
ncbi:MAG TPA: helix-turn-helix domain-containing protein [Prevotella sp.]|nr:helix-turn-helix domain-containing protein [Prevotella sp.]